MTNTSLQMANLPDNDFDIPKYNPKEIDRNDEVQVNDAVNQYVASIAKYFYVALGLDKTYGPLEDRASEITPGLRVGDQFELVFSVHGAFIKTVLAEWHTFSEAERVKMGKEETRIANLIHKLKTIINGA